MLMPVVEHVAQNKNRVNFFDGQPGSELIDSA
jgi:hypothetical protein